MSELGQSKRRSDLASCPLLPEERARADEVVAKICDRMPQGEAAFAADNPQHREDFIRLLDAAVRGPETKPENMSPGARSSAFGTKRELNLTTFLCSSSLPFARRGDPARGGWRGPLGGVALWTSTSGTHGAARLFARNAHGRFSPPLRGLSRAMSQHTHAGVYECLHLSTNAYARYGGTSGIDGVDVGESRRK